ncbi:MAG: tail fiber domain-containing protein [Nitrospiraceae bacterium]
MRIWVKCVWDFDGNIIEDESRREDYAGPIAEAKGGSTSTTTVDPPTAEETALTVKQTELAEFQLTELRRQTELQIDQQDQLDLFLPVLLEQQGLRAIRADAGGQAPNPEFTKIQDAISKLETSPPEASVDLSGLFSGGGALLFEASGVQSQLTDELNALLTGASSAEQLEILQGRLANTPEFISGTAGEIIGFEQFLTERQQFQQDTEDELLRLELENIKRGGAATPEQLELIGQATELGIQSGESDIAKFQSDATERIAQELAPALGLRPTDTPVLDRAGRVAEEAVRQQGQLVTGLRQAEATASLNFPLAAQQLQSSQTQFQQQLAQATSQFQSQLRNSAFLNRLRLSEAPQQFGLGLATGVSVPGLGRAPSGSRTVTSGGGGIGIGSLLSFGGSVIGAFSSRELKRDPEGIGLSSPRQIDHEETLAKVEKLPVERWRYKEGLGLGDRDHLGPYAQDVEESFGIGDGETINYLDAIGIGLSATKGLAERVHKIEHGIGLAGA